jgi:hypothetical protein
MGTSARAAKAPHHPVQRAAKGGLPDFIVIGAMKAGSTTLHRYLRGHPQIVMSDPKELHYFVEERSWSEGEDWYRSHFPVRPGVVCGEASVTYTQAALYAGVPARMAQVVPQARLIYLLRDPVERMRSHYVHELAALREHLPIERALCEQPKYLDVSRYAGQLDRFLAHYPQGQILLLTSEALFARPREVLAQVFTFLGVDPSYEPPAPVHVNQSSRKSVPSPFVHRLRSSHAARAVVHRIPVPMRDRIKAGVPRRPLDPQKTVLSEEFRDELRAELRPDVRRLRPLLGADVDAWGIG